MYIFNYVNTEDIIKLSFVCSDLYNIIGSFEWNQILTINSFNNIPKNISFDNIFLEYPLVTNLISIKNVVFVDAQYGASTCVRGKETRPFQTLLQGLSAALFGDTIYVRSGFYETTTIVLVDNVNWYFTDETTVTASIGYIFTDDARPVTSSIISQGTFRLVDSLIKLSAGSTINLEVKIITTLAETRVAQNNKTKNLHKKYCNVSNKQQT